MQQDDISILADPSRANRYEYSGDNPVNYIDPAGKFSLFGCIFGGTLGAGSIGGTVGSVALGVSEFGAGEAIAGVAAFAAAGPIGVGLGLAAFLVVSSTC